MSMHRTARLYFAVTALLVWSPLSADPPSTTSSPAHETSGLYSFRRSPPDTPRGREIRAIMQRFDPAGGGWSSECRVAEIEEELRRMLAAAATGKRSDGPAQAALAADFQAAFPPFAAPHRILSDGFFIVDRAHAIEHGPPPITADRLPAALDHWLAHFGEEVSLDLHVTSYEEAPVDRFATDVRASFFGRRQNGPAQINTNWRMEWRSEPTSSRPLLKSMRLVDWEMISAPRTLLADCTESILGANPCWASQLVHGADQWSSRTDRLGGWDLLCHTGLAVGDANADGLDDLYVCQPGGIANRLFLQQPDGTARDVSREAGVDFLDLTRAALFVDLDNDGDRDLVLSLRNSTVVLDNDGAAHFKVRLAPRTSSPSDFYSIAAADIDRNGFVDLYSCRYVKASYGISIPVPYFDARNGPANLLLANFGPKGFDDGTDRTGLAMNNNRFSLAAAWEDFDQDGDDDLFVANDFGIASLYRRDGDRFVDAAGEIGALNRAAGMGVSWADYDGDGWVDLYVSNMSCSAGTRIMSQAGFRRDESPEQRAEFRSHAAGNALFRNVDGRRFENVGEAAGVAHAGWSWGGLFADLNGDGREDLLVPNGNLTSDDPRDLRSFFWREVAIHSPRTYAPQREYENGWGATTEFMQRRYSWSGRERDHAFLNLGDGTFADVSALVGFDSIEDGRAVAVTDWDGDGDLDVWLKSRTGPQIRFLRNDGPARSWIGLSLEGQQCNRDAIGARVEVHAGGRRQVRSLHAGEGYLAQSSRVMRFGLGQSTSVDKVVVHWPGGEKQEYSDLVSGNTCRLVQGETSAVVAKRDPATLRIQPSPPSAPRPLPERIVLADAMPLPDLPYTGAAGGPASLVRHFGKPSLLMFWSSGAPGGNQAPAGLLKQVFADCCAASVNVLAICVDEHLPDWASSPGAELPPIGLLSNEMRDVVDTALGEIRGLRAGVRLPLVLVLDDVGRIRAIHQGAASRDLWLADAAGDPQKELDSSGRWQFRQKRALAPIARELARLGHRDSATFYTRFAGQPGP